jgi:hypothetical protein
MFLALGALPLVAEDGFTPLFDGKSLDGWHKAGGGATYKVEGDCIVGEVGPGGNTFLCTDKTYHDFILQLELKLDVPGNSGIQFRSHKREGDGRVFGYQCEIDPSDRAWSGGIYDEARRGWLFPLTLNEPARRAFKVDGWNEYVIKAVGPHIQTWVNGVPCADLFDPMDIEGFIALQVHAGNEGRIRWRNIGIKELGRHEWVPIWDGKSLDGWHTIPGGSWTIEDGAIVGRSPASEPRHGLLVTDKIYDDFSVRVEYLANQGNSGLYFRVDESGDAVGVHGFQAEIDPEKDAGGLYETAGRAWVVQPAPEDVKKWYKPGEWNEMVVCAYGQDVSVFVNGTKTAELKDDPGRTKGRIALQLHGGMDMDVRFRKVEVLLPVKGSGG